MKWLVIPILNQNENEKASEQQRDSTNSTERSRTAQLTKLTFDLELELDKDLTILIAMMNKNYKIKLLNVLFVFVCTFVLYFLWNAPKETTKHLPHDENHKQFFAMKEKKEAEQYCLNCHDQDKVAPLPKDHPPKYRCLLCHKAK